MRPSSWPSWLLCPTVVLLSHLLAHLLASDVECSPEEGCVQPAPRYDDIFDDEEMSISLLQMKAKQIQAHRSELEAKEADALTEADTQAPKSSDKEFSDAQSARAPEKERVHISTMQAPPLALDFVSLSKFDSQSRFYLFHLISTTVKERGQIAVFILGSVLFLTIFLVSSAAGSCRKKDQVLQVQVRVDHFVTHSMTSKKIVEAPLKAPMPHVFHNQASLKAPMPHVFPNQTPSKLPVETEMASDNGCTMEPASEPPCGDLAGEQCARPKPMQSSTVVCPVELRKGTPALIDPAFLLPLCETWYAVCVEPMAICDGSFDILRIAGYPVLHGTVRHADGMRVLEITCSSLPAKQGQVLASVAIEDPAPVAETSSGAAGLLKVTAAGNHYGSIRPVAEKAYVLSCDQEDVMTLSTEDGRQLVLRCAEDSKVLASASWFEHSDFFSGAGHLAIRVNPSVDTILVLSCALALTILGGNTNLIQCTRPADRGAG